MTKFKAAIIHIMLSVVVISLLFCVVYYVWYPKPFFELSGVIEPFKLLIIIDIVVGPLLTFVVYKKGKKSLKMDLSIIAAMQLAAIIYGAIVIHNGRPSIVVFNKGQFNYLVESIGDNNDLIYAELNPSLFSKPKLAYINNFNEQEIYNGFAYFEPISNYETMLKPHSLTIENMKAKFKGKIAELQALSNVYSNKEIVFFKLNHMGSFYYVVYSIKQNQIIDYLKF